MIGRKYLETPLTRNATGGVEITDELIDEIRQKIDEHECAVIVRTEKSRRGMLCSRADLMRFVAEQLPAEELFRIMNLDTSKYFLLVFGGDAVDEGEDNMAVFIETIDRQTFKDGQ